jgi:SAM-dependent methyltransferase
MPMAAPALYLLSDAERQRKALALQSRVWEPAARALLQDLDLPADARVLRVGFGEHDHSAPGTGTFDLVHARFQLSSLGRADEQLEAYTRLLRPGGVLILEDPDSRGWGLSPEAPAAAALMDLIRDAYALAGGDLDMGRRLPNLMRDAGLEPYTTAQILTLEPGHPYLRMPLQLAAGLEPRLVELAGADEVTRLREEAEAEVADARRWGTTFTLVQARARVG